MKRHAFLVAMVVVAIVWPGRAISQASTGMVRTWVDRQGTTFKAALVQLAGTDLILRMEDGTVTKMAVARLSQADLAYVRSLPASGPAAPASAVPSGPVASGWPGKIAIDTAKLSVQQLSQPPQDVNYVYTSGDAKITSQVQLADPVKVDIARDCELVRQAVAQFPWNWQPKPVRGDWFQEEIYSDIKTFDVAGGWTGSEGCFISGGRVLTYLQGVGLKLVGKRANWDRANREALLVSTMLEQRLGWLRTFSAPWWSYGLCGFVERVAWQDDGSLDFTPNPKAHREALNNYIRQMAPLAVSPSARDMVKFFHQSWGGTVEALERRARCFHGTLLIYYFGYLDGDGKGTRLHEATRFVAKTAMQRQENANGFSNEERIVLWEAAAKIYTQGRTDDALQSEMVSKFQAAGIKVVP